MRLSLLAYRAYVPDDHLEDDRSDGQRSLLCCKSTATRLSLYEPTATAMLYHYAPNNATPIAMRLELGE